MAINFDFTQYSYEDLVRYITSVVNDSDAWKDAQDSSTAQVLIQLLAAGTDQLHYMLERRTQETFFPTAQLDTTVGALASLSGYRPKRTVAARGELNLTITDRDGNPIQLDSNIFLPRYTIIKYDDIPFVTLDEYILTPSTVWPYRLRVAQGTIESKTYNTDSEETFLRGNYINVGDFAGVDEEEFRVVANGEPYFDIRSYELDNSLGTLAFAAPKDPVYDLRIAHDGLRIVFGNGEYGKEPTGFIGLDYLLSQGKSVEINNINTPFTFAAPLRTSLGTNVKYTLSNATPITGGTDPESVGETKVYAPEYIRANNRAVTKRDFDYWLMRSPINRIVDVYSYTEEELDVMRQHVNTIFVAYLTEDGTPLDYLVDTKATAHLDSEHKQFMEFINQYKTMTTNISLKNVKPVKMKVDCKVHLNEDLGVPMTAIYDSVRNNLIDSFKFGKKSLGKGFHTSEIVYDMMQHTMNVTGVDKDLIRYIDVDFKPMIEVSPRYTGHNVYLEVMHDVGTEPSSDPLGGSYTQNDIVVNVDGTDYTILAGAGNGGFEGTNTPLPAAMAMAAKLTADLPADYVVQNPLAEPVVGISRLVGGEKVDVTVTVKQSDGTQPSNVRVKGVRYALTHAATGNVDLIPHDNLVHIPQAALVNRDRNPFIVKGTVELVEKDTGLVIGKDGHSTFPEYIMEVDGNGNFVADATARKLGRIRYGDETIDEVDIEHWDGAVHLFDLDEKDYMLRWTPPEDANVVVSPRSAIGLAEPVPSLNDTSDPALDMVRSTIEFV